MIGHQDTAPPLALPSWSPTVRELDDLEMMLLGGYRPLRGFVGLDDIEAIRTCGVLTNGTTWPVPVTLVVPSHIAELAVKVGAIELLDEEATPVAEVAVDGAWPTERGVGLAGVVRALRPFERGIHRSLPHVALGRRDRAVLGVPLRRPLLAPGLAALRSCAAKLDARLLLLPLIGHGSPQEIDVPGLVRAANGAGEQLIQQGCEVDVVPVPVPRHDIDEDRDRILAALVAKEYGATHVPGPLPALEALPTVIELPAVAQDMRTGRWATADMVPAKHRGPRDAAEVPGPVSCAVAGGQLSPPGFDGAERESRRFSGVTARRGVTVLFTGLSGAGKSTIAKAVESALVKRTERTVTLLDGDIVRRMLSAELTFSREHRELNVRRIGFVAAEITRHGGIALCAPIAPYAEVRDEVRTMVEEHGRFLLVHVSTSLEVCEDRDRKGLYAKARRGEIREFTGISDPYENPVNADLVIDTSRTPIDDAVERVLAAIHARS